MMKVKADIATEEDIKLVVDSFYEKVKVDELLAGAFAHVNWPAHLPKMYQFWSSLVFETYNYKGNPFEKHQSLPINRMHFDRWLLLFIETVDHHFEGKRATKMKNHAYQIATIFQNRMNLIS